MDDNQDDFEHQIPPEQPDPPVDPAVAATDALMYGDETAPEKLRVAVNDEIARHERWKALEAETARTTAIVNRFRAENPDIDGDEDLRAATESCLVREQRDDLLKLGLVDEARLGRPLTRQEVTSLHQQARVLGHAVRSPETLLGHARDTLTEKFNLRRRERDPSESILARKNAARNLRGLPPLLGDGTPAESYTPMTNMSSEDFTKGVGFGGDVEATSEPSTDRSSAVEKMIHARRSLRRQDGKMFTPERNR
jgi:hypothetical protein